MSLALKLQENPGQLIPTEIEEDHNSMSWVMASLTCVALEQDAEKFRERMRPLFGLFGLSRLFG